MPYVSTIATPASAVLPGSGASRPVARRGAAIGKGLALTLWGGLAVGAVYLTAAPAESPRPPAVAAVIGLLTLFVAAIVTTFSLRYMRADRMPQRFFVTTGLLVASVLLFVGARDLVSLALGWCASGVLLARLIGHDLHWREARQASRRALGAFVLGDTALLGALAVLGLAAGTLRIDAVLAAVPGLPPQVTLAAAGLLLIAAAARCALPPFSGWLLSSMTAPTPVSALMHAGLVNAGGFLLIRFAPLLEAAPAVRAAAIGVGLIAALYGLGVMRVRPDVKRSLAGSTVSQMGFMIMSCGLGAYAAALWHIVAHGLFKAWLFLGSGSSIGIRDDKAAVLGGPAIVAGVALATLVAGGGAIFGGTGPDATYPAGGLIPLVLGLATALVTLIAGLRSRLPLRARLGIGLVVAALIAFHGAGLRVMQAGLGPDAPALLPPGALFALLAGFLAAWVWQVCRRSTPLPPALYIHLLNAGSAPATAES